ncbi:hypothetical protein ACIRBX_25770 [Kitasatospora sp. NPDC096147]|uniref:WXG100-like domain-containing protein n=1 Tax=Kitasatospora sp. NPDC096147 TaxID=3364093 RepID=UPI0037F25BCA
MAIELPGELVWVMDLIGFNWPEVNEDKVREFADQVRRFATDIDGTHQTATSVIRQMAEHYQADSYQRLVDRWTAMSSDHMDELVQICNASAIVLDVAADAIVAAKIAVITQLGIAAAELAAATAASVATLGVAAAAEVALIEVQKRIINAILREVEEQVIGMLVAQAVDPLVAVVERAATGLVFRGVQAAVNGVASGGGGSGDGFRVNPQELLRCAAMLDEHADQVAAHARAFAGATSGVSFS